MDIFCEKSTEVKKDTQNEKAKEIDYESLPQKYVSGKNFV